MAHGQKFDVAVLGAGMLGVATAIHLQERGATVVLVDRRGPGEETSYGNAGLIQREGIHPYLFPRDFRKLVGYGLNRRSDAHYQLSSLPSVAPFLLRYFKASGPESAHRTMMANIPLFAVCLSEHEELAKKAGSEGLIRKRGWVRLMRSEASMKGGRAQVAELAGLGIHAQACTPDEITALEPDLDVSRIVGGVHYRDPWSVTDPGALVQSYAKLFEKLGGQYRRADARSARRDGSSWVLDGEEGPVSAERMVVALGPWSKAFLAERGLDLPAGIKRGYHCHYRPNGGKTLNHTVIDDDMGFALAPMAKGIRLTTGAEFARMDAPRTPVQIDRCLPLARQLFDLGEPVEAEPWMGSRPVFPDLLPAMGPAEGLVAGNRHELTGVWLNFGHGHHGFTLGPAVGKLVAQMMIGETPYCDPTPYSAARFLS